MSEQAVTNKAVLGWLGGLLSVLFIILISLIKIIYSGVTASISTVEAKVDVVNEKQIEISTEQQLMAKDIESLLKGRD